MLKREIKAVRDPVELLEMKISEIKNSLGRINSWLDTAKEKISEFEDRAIKTIQIEIHREKKTEAVTTSSVIWGKYEAF